MDLLTHAYHVMETVAASRGIRTVNDLSQEVLRLLARFFPPFPTALDNREVYLI